MPELPEVEHLRRSLEPRLLGAAVKIVRLRRRDVLTRSKGAHGRSAHADLLRGQQIQELRRHGKNLALIGSSGGVVNIHLGMSGQLRVLKNGIASSRLDHVHCEWRLLSPDGPCTLIFRDPRRFGGLWTFPTLERLYQERWNSLGPDALTICVESLTARLASTHRSIKAALLDQSILAGVGNIYADEALFAAGIRPSAITGKLGCAQIARLVKALNQVFQKALAAGGSTLRSYADADGRSGSFTAKHQVYGRGGLPCVRCGKMLRKTSVCQRTTVHCPSCQSPE